MCTPLSVNIRELLIHSMNWGNPNEVVTSKLLWAEWPSYLYWGAFYFYYALWFLGSFHLASSWKNDELSRKTLPLFTFCWFPPRGVASHRLPCGRRRRPGRCRLVRARSSACTRPSCLDERTSWSGEDCQSQSDCSLSLSLCLPPLSFSLFLSQSPAVWPNIAADWQAAPGLPVLVIHILKCRPPFKRKKKIKEGWTDSKLLRVDMNATWL